MADSHGCQEPPHPSEPPPPLVLPENQSISIIPAIQVRNALLIADSLDTQKVFKDLPAFTVADEEDGMFDGDSAYGAYSDVTDTVSLNSSLMKFREENGRTYHSFGKLTLHLLW